MHVLDKAISMSEKFTKLRFRDCVSKFKQILTYKNAYLRWMCSSQNLASARLATKIGHEKVGVIPYHMRFPLGKKTGKVGNGRPPPPGSAEDDLWRDSFIYSMTWIKWGEARGKIQSEMDR